ncbi:hypothetical protein ACIQW7_12810 [Peribacillus simplex]|uniref:hypothetical protein n=1 Tax=Peribacillus simplex TaxID=1478 RepID=UPI0037FBBDEB
MKIPKLIAIFLQSWSDGSSHALKINHASLPEKRRYYILRGEDLLCILETFTILLNDNYTNIRAILLTNCSIALSFSTDDIDNEVRKSGMKGLDKYFVKFASSHFTRGDVKEVNRTMFAN